jgi:hypothetical protein
VSPSPPEALRRELELARARGVGFERAWRAACERVLAGRAERAGWAEALRSTRASWELAYARRGARRLHDARVMLEAVELVREQQDAGGRGGRLVA